jgi:hypothetical protein
VNCSLWTIHCELFTVNCYDWWCRSTRNSESKEQRLINELFRNNNTLLCTVLWSRVLLVPDSNSI